MTIQEALDYLNQYRNAGNHIHREAMDMAIEVLEKQIPKKLIETEEFVEGSCQNCKRNIGWIKDEYFDFDNCPFCGQAIDFGGE